MIRAFVSIPIPDTPGIERLREELRDAGLRPSPPEQTHITLRFIGDIDESLIGTLTSCVERSVSGFRPFELKVSGMGAFPNEGRPSVIWMGASPGDIMGAMAGRLGSELRRAGIGFDTKPFKPHVTMARVRGQQVPRGIFEDHRYEVFATTECTEVRVMSSVLGPGGARHSVLSRVPLGGVRI